MQELEIISHAALVRVHARPHPGATTVFAEFRHGLSLREIVGPDGRQCRVEVGGMTLPQEYWHLVRPKVGCAVVITRMPQGGSVKSIFRLIAFAALAVAVVYTGGLAGAALPGFLGGATISAAGATLLAAGVGLVGSLIINALIPPQTPDTGATSSVDTLRSITGTQNQLNPYGAVPVVLGEVLMFPPHAAKQYSELSGDDQYIRCLFDLGEGDPVASEMKIGDSDIATFTDVETETGTSPTLFSQDVEEAAAGNALNTDGNSATKSSATDADELSIDLAYASGLFGADSSGNVVSVTSNVRVEFAPQGTGNFQSVSSDTPGLTISSTAAVAANGIIAVTNAAKKAVRVGVRWKVTNGQYDVRVTRVSTNWGSASDDGKVGDLTWTVIRTIRYGEVSKTGTKKIAVRIKATDQLNGAISQFNCIVAQPIPVWHSDTGTWVTEVSRNPAWIYRWLMTGCPGNPRLVGTEREDDDELKAWGADCDAKGLVYSNCVDQMTTLFALLQDVCAAGRASFNVRDSKYSVVRDTPQNAPVQVFTPRNSWGFSGTRAFPDAVHALRVQFTNPEASWQQDERVVYDDGYDATNATKFEVLTLRGVTDADAAWRLARYHLAVSRLRPNVYSWSADIENLVCTRGDLVLCANDVISVGRAWGRVSDIVLNDAGNAVQISLDEQMLPELGGSYSLRVRRQDGGFALSAVTFNTVGEPTQTAKLVTPLAGINYGDLAIFGDAGTDVLTLKVKAVEPGEDLTAKITAVDAAPAVLTADAGTPPAWASSITGQSQISAPAPPSIVDVSSSQLLSPSDDGGITQPVMIVSVSGPWSGVSNLLDHIEIRYRTGNPVGAWSVQALARGERSLTVASITRAADYQVEARAVGENGQTSSWTATTHTTALATLGPDESPVLSVSQMDSRSLLNWTPVPQADVSYELRYSDDPTNSEPDTWSGLFYGSATSTYDFPPNGINRSYAVRAVTYSGVPSAWSNIVTGDAYTPGP